MRFPYWRETELRQIEPLDPYRLTEAETIAWGYGLDAEKDSDGRIYVTDIADGETLTVEGVDFGSGAQDFSALVAADKPGCAIEIHLDSADGPVVGWLAVTPTGFSSAYEWQRCAVVGASGVHDLVFRFV